MREQRQAAGMTQRQVANALIVDQSTINHWESGRNRISFVDFARWCRACGVGRRRWLQAFAIVLGRDDA